MSGEGGLTDLRPTKSASARPLINRHAELQALGGLITELREGASGVLVLRGGPGIGKTTLLEHVIEAAAGTRIARVGGVESELDLPYAGLHQLLGPFLPGIDELPRPQHNALASALGLIDAGQSERFLIALAALTLLSNAAAETAVFCAVDDTELLDEASRQVLSFVARRLDPEGMGMLFTVGTPNELPVFLKGFPLIDLDGLSKEASCELLGSEVSGKMDTFVRDRVIDESEGNPLALLQFAQALTSEQLAGQVPLPDALPLGERLEHNLMRHVRELSSDAQSVLLLVAAERSGDPDVLRRAADDLGLASTSMATAETVLRLGPQITFRHGLVRSAVYASASELSLRDAHLALANAMDPDRDRDRAAWHRAAASTEADETVAAELEASARKAWERGGHAAAAAVLELASDLTPDPSLRASRLLVATEAQLAAGALGKASALLSQASPNLLDERQRAEARRLQGVLALSKGENGHTVTLLRDAARSLEPFDLRLARDTHLAALSSAMFAGRLGARGGLLETAEAARSAPKLPASEITAADVLLDGFAALYLSGPASAEPALRRGVVLAQRGRALQPVGPAFQAAFELWDDEALHVLAKLRVELARSSGALIELPNALSQLGGYELVVGRFDAAEASFNEAREVAIATGNPGILGQSEVGALYLAAWRGQEAAVRALAPVCARDATARGFGTFVGFAQYAICILELGRGHYRDAMIAATDAGLDSLLKTRALPEVVESAARSGERETATQALGELVESASASGTRWGRGVLARSRALLAEGAEAEELYREAIGHLQQCRATPQLARARLVYGEWLRRSKRRRDARDELRTGLQLFQAMGAGAFADRAESELLATGERIQRRSGGTAQLLTAHERRIVALVIEGASNSEVASQLFISPRTVEYHLAKVFRKVGVTSRAELSPTLVEIPDEGGA